MTMTKRRLKLAELLAEYRKQCQDEIAQKRLVDLYRGKSFGVKLMAIIKILF